MHCVQYSVINAASIICFLLARYLSLYLQLIKLHCKKKQKNALKSRLKFVCSVATYVKQFGGDLEQKRLDLTWSAQVDFTAATPRLMHRPTMCICATKSTCCI